jgi:UDP-glucuronate 4-epimerase
MNGVRDNGRAVVTGVAGFIGAHLAEALLERGTTVLGIDRCGSSSDDVAGRNLAGLLGRPGFRMVQGDLRELDLPKLLSGADVVFHLAGVPGVRPSWGDRFGEYLSANVLATQRLLESGIAVGLPRFVVASSSSVYGGSKAPSREDDPPAPLSPYGVTKLAAEQLSLAYAARPECPTSVVALRYFTVYGPRQRPDMAMGRILKAVWTGRPLRLYGDGTQRRDFTYVDDVVAATVAAASAPARAEVVNVGGGRTVSMLEVLECAAEVTGRQVPVVSEERQAGDVEATEADLGKARLLLGYEPAVCLEDGIGRQWRWFRSQNS